MEAPARRRSYGSVSLLSSPSPHPPPPETQLSVEGGLEKEPSKGCGKKRDPPPWTADLQACSPPWTADLLACSPHASTEPSCQVPDIRHEDIWCGFIVEQSSDFHLVLEVGGCAARGAGPPRLIALVANWSRARVGQGVLVATEVSTEPRECRQRKPVRAPTDSRAGALPALLRAGACRRSLLLELRHDVQKISGTYAEIVQTCLIFSIIIQIWSGLRIMCPA